MEDKDRREFGLNLAGLQQVFRPMQVVSPEVVETYWRVFKSWPIERFKLACERTLVSKKINTFPLPSEIMDAGTDETISLRAWLEARSLVSKYGSWYNLQIQDYAIYRTIEAMGGWCLFCQFTYSEMPFRQKEFERLYKLFEHGTGEIGLLVGMADNAPTEIVGEPDEQKRIEE